MKRLNHICVLLVACSSTFAMAKGDKSKKVKKVSAKAVDESGQESSDDSATKAQHQDYDAPWGMAGCGFWSTVIKGKGRDSQLAVSVLKGLPYLGSTDSQTSGITSGTSNCVKSRTQLEEAEQRTFVTVNLASLVKESSQGAGQHLEALAEIFGCPHTEFAQFSQRRYGVIYQDQNPDLVLANYIREVQAESSMASSCQRVG